MANLTNSFSDKNKKYLYRYVRNSHAVCFIGIKSIIVNPTIKLLQFEIIKETNKGFFIFNDFEKRFVLKTGKKKFASETKEEALVDFNLRQKRCVELLESQLSIARAFLNNDFKII